MNLTSASRTFQLLSRVFDVRTATESFLPTPGEKISTPLRPVENPLPRATPESEGISSDHIRGFLEELGRGSDLFIQNAMILRHGKVLCAAAYGGQKLESVKYTFSACKSITSLAVGLLIDDGKLHLHDTLTDLFGEEMTANVRRRTKNLTVEDLLTMRSGVLFSEPEALTESDWVRSFLLSATKGEGGEEFYYNSLNTYLLSVIVRIVSGESLTSFLTRRLFTPLGITDIHWEKCPAGFEKGGWGLYIRPEDMAKLGQLVMDEGLWQGQQLISRDYIRAATTAHATPPPELGDFNYGYQIWVGRKENTFLFNGMLGQNVLGFRDSGIIVLTNAGADTDYQESRYFEIVSRYFGGSFPQALPEDPAAQARLADCIRSLTHYNRSPQPLDERAKPFLHRSFTARDAKAASVGLLPLSLQLLHNNYTTGVKSVAISQQGNIPELIYREADAIHRLPIGLGAPRVTELTFRGDHYHVSALGRFTHDEEERPVFYIRLEFLETPCVRILKMVDTGDGLLLKQSETPGVPYILKKLRTAAEQSLTKPLLLVALGGTDPDYLHFKTLQLLSPEITMVADN